LPKRNMGLPIFYRSGDKTTTAQIRLTATLSFGI
jgi:hypothetical protein